jgi:hypothetical protein
MIIFGVVLYYCRHRLEINVDNAHRKWSFGWHVQKVKESKRALNRRRSVQGVSGHEAPTIHNRRPSEEAVNISGKDHYTFNFQYWIIILRSPLCVAISLTRGSH